MDYPEVPALEVPCEICGAPVTAGQGSLPLNCPHCGKRLRPKTDSVWSHFSYVLFHRLFTRKGRATRKEFWSFIPLVCILFTVCLLFCLIFYMELAFLDVFSGFFTWFIVVFSCFALLFLLFTFPIACVSARRLHDVSVSGNWAMAHYVLSCCIYLTILHSVGYVVYNYLSAYNDAEMMEQVLYVVSDDCVLSDCDTSFVEPFTLDYIASEEYFDSQTGTKMLSHPVNGSFFSIACFADILLGIFLFAFSFVDSTPGPNQYGPSRKYLRN